MDQLRNVAVIMNIDSDLLPFLHSEQRSWHTAVISDGLNYLVWRNLKFDPSDAKWKTHGAGGGLRS